jgi:hypothetical protein
MTGASHKAPSGRQFTSEVAYDLLVDHVDTILALRERPLSHQETVARLGSEAVLARMLRQGLIAKEGEQYHAVATTYQHMRQEGMMSFLEHAVLPTMTATIAEGRGFGVLHNRYLMLDDATIRGLRQGAVQDLIHAVSAESEKPVCGMTARLTILVVGTTVVERSALDDGDRALVHLKNASMQRSDPAQQAQAVLTWLSTNADSQSFQGSMKHIDTFLAGFDAERAAPEDATYHFTIACHWRCTTATESDLRPSC